MDYYTPSPTRQALAAVLLPLAVVVLYGPSLAHGLTWDDFPFVVRPYRLADVGRALIGPWSGVEAPFYRPGAIALFTLRDWTIGADPVALHALSLAGAVGVAWLFAAWLRRLGVSPLTATVAACGLLTHPVFATSAVLWITNHMHLAQLAVVLGALVLPPTRWPWLLAGQALAMSLKEDGLVLGPLLALQAWRRGERLPGAWWTGTIVLTGLYVGVRAVAVPALVPTLSPMAVSRALRDSGLAGEPFGLWGGVPLVALGLLGLRRTRAWALPIALVGFGSLPLLLTSGGPTRTHLLVVGVVALLALSAEATRSRWPTLVVALATIIGLESVIVTRGVVAAHAPCHPQTLARDRGVLDWPVSDAVRDAVTTKLSQCDRASGSAFRPPRP